MSRTAAYLQTVLITAFGASFLTVYKGPDELMSPWASAALIVVILGVALAVTWTRCLRDVAPRALNGSARTAYLFTAFIGLLMLAVGGAISALGLTLILVFTYDGLGPRPAA